MAQALHLTGPSLSPSNSVDLLCDTLYFEANESGTQLTILMFLCGYLKFLYSISSELPD